MALKKAIRFIFYDSGSFLCKWKNNIIKEIDEKFKELESLAGKLNQYMN